MKNQFKNNPLSLEELAKWINDTSYNPRSGCKISENGQLFKVINKSYLENKSLVDNLYEKLYVKYYLDPKIYLTFRVNNIYKTVIQWILYSRVASLKKSAITNGF